MTTHAELQAATEATCDCPSCVAKRCAKQQTRIAELEARCAMLQEKLWTVLKDRRDAAEQEAISAVNDLKWAKAQGLNSHLPTSEDIIALKLTRADFVGHEDCTGGGHAPSVSN